MKRFRLSAMLLAGGIITGGMLLGEGLTATAVDLGAVKPLTPEVAEASDEPAEAMAAISLRDGWKIDLWAAEPKLANVVAFDIDRKGNVYVCETFRQNRGVTDNRGHDRTWLLADLAAKTVQDRIDYHIKLLGDTAVTYAQHDDRIRRLTDTDGDGTADESVIVADGFNHLEEGTGAGVLAIGNSVYYTCIPKLWKLVDQNGDGKADERVVLSDGYGVRVAFRGHDMHGLIRGYDGRLYFTIGDRGYHLRNAEGELLSDPASGAMFRCELDGSGLEVFARGLRNPQEIAFNDQGDWFTVDNNSDSGDRARIVHILQDGDTGWRMYYQYLPDRGPFNREKIWHPQNDEQPAAIVPPIENFTDGPSGLAYYPGTGFGDSLKDTFLVCDFRGGPSNSGIRTFQLEPNGATYKLGENSQPVWSCLATDLAFGNDGSLYVSDWVNGWDGLGKGRLYKISDAEHQQDAIVAEVRDILASDLTKAETDTLALWLGHPDRRVRLESQWELAARRDTDALAKTATLGESPLARLHAVWGLGEVARKDASDQLAKTAVVDLLTDKDANVRFAALTIAGEQGWSEAVDAALPLINDENARVRYAAIDALGRSKSATAMSTVLERIVGADGKDAAIRHASAMYLSRAANAGQLKALTKHPSVEVRRLAVVALRRQGSGEVAEFLADQNVQVVLEAARAIHDKPIQVAMPALAKLINGKFDNEALIMRVINANYRQGTQANAAALANFATRTDVSPKMRIEALDMLAHWANPDPLDRVIGDYRPLEIRSAVVARDALTPHIDLLLAAPENVRLKAIDTASELGIAKIADVLEKQVIDSSRSTESRSKLLIALSRLQPEVAVRIAKAIPPEQTRGDLGKAKLTVLADRAPGESIDTFIAATSNSDVNVQQKAWDILGKLPSPQASQTIDAAVTKYIDGKLDPRVQLNVVEASKGKLSDDLKSKFDDYRNKLAETDPLATWLDSLAGGDVEAGKKLFFGKTELSCVRCHTIGRSGGQVGPKLTVIGKERDPRYLLESICLPDAKVAEGFETAVIIDIDGKVHSGIVKMQNDDVVELMLADGTQETIAQDDIEVRKKGKSSMPADLVKQMSARELRDLVAYLSSLKVDPRGADDVE
ncbi:PVC-type heme-binding CxxCH protein [Rhodopirellula sp. MGV]|uniref:PVC-type heme-binding CxxCH protein n=1 Tax=Rhodopirellula sp. MGV TaxID=2023130 RepID=UPI000B96040B|nr:PVC-type heme-binding CxxCH protein [Rhodopirellula sp. MGV]OYP28241.1 glucose dehydrogenase [Rhodopirellula sp. MGV]PNY34242.1 glucose dehydrogenase [Rhodopirellula baltica]